MGQLTENHVHLKGEVVNIPVFKKQCKTVDKEKLNFVVKCAAAEGHYAIIPVAIWGDLAVKLRDRVLKGTILSVDGSLGTWSFQSSARTKNKQFAVNASDVKILSKRKKD